MEIINTKDLGKKYLNGEEEFMAVSGVNLKVQKGEFVIILGKSGCGKSTLLHMLGGLDKPSTGNVFINNTDIYKLSDKNLTIFRRKYIGFIYQFFNLIPSLTVYENIVLPALFDGRQIDEVKLDNLLKTLDVLEKKDFLPNDLSGGQQQRVAIGRAVINKPKIILADEPTGNLDSRSSNKLMKLLAFYNKKFKQTIIMVTHDEELVKWGTRVITMADGKIIKDEKIVKNTSKKPLRDKKELVISLLSIVLASVLMFTVALVFSAAHHCLIKTVNKGYTVIIEGKLKGYDNYLKKGDYYFNFRPKDVYEKVESICEKGVCNKIIYNNKLLSLYGIGDDNYLKTIKNILVFILGIIAVSVFLIIYNSFKVSFSKRKSEIIIMKAIGLESGKIIAMCLFEQIIISLLGILFGFVLALFLTDGLILILNELLKEIIKEDIKIYFNFSFILISLLFIIGVSFISCFLAVLKIRKYQIMDIFREKLQII